MGQCAGFCIADDNQKVSKLTIDEMPSKNPFAQQ
jgi:hypothetical protein